MMQTQLLFCPNCRRHFDADRGHCPSDGSNLLPVPGDLPSVGQLLDQRLLVKEEIASGGMGIIFRAFDLNERRDVALKVLKPEFNCQATVVHQFYREARAARRLRHPHIVEVFEFGRTSDGHLFISMELLQGQALAECLNDQRGIGTARTVHVTMQILAALDYAHRRGTVHRDLKPENVQLCAASDGRDAVKMLDFGIARVLDFDRDGDAEGAGVVAGTPVYMSPEQIQGKPTDPRSDLYAVGILLHEMLVGVPPFLDENPTTVCRRHLRDPVRPFAHRVPDRMPAAFERLILQLLEKDPTQRPASAAAVTERLLPIQRQVGLAPVLYRPQDWYDLADSRQRQCTLRTGIAALENISVCLTPQELPASPALAEPPIGLPTSLQQSTEPGERLQALWLCAACGRLNVVPEGCCEFCGTRLQAPLVGVPAARLPDQRMVAWHPETGGRLAEGVSARTLVLLHAVFAGNDSMGIPLPADMVARHLNPEIQRWLAMIRAQGAELSRQHPDIIRVVFGWQKTTSSDWLSAAGHSAAALVRAVAHRALATGLDLRVRVGLAGGTVFLSAQTDQNVDRQVCGSPIDLACRLARCAPYGTVLLNEWFGRRLQPLFQNRPFDAIRVRERTTPETIFTLGPPVAVHDDLFEPAGNLSAAEEPAWAV